MLHKPQVSPENYEFGQYMTHARWNSVWHQLSLLYKFQPGSVLEIGPGPGIFKTTGKLFGIPVETMDIDPELNPDHIGSATNIPFPDHSYDVICAFQMLEHLPYETALQAFAEMARVSKSHVLISLPDSWNVWRYRIHIPKFGPKEFLIPRPRLRAPVHKFDGQHYWEINKQDYSLSRIIKDFSKHMPLIQTYRVAENPYHRFFVFKHSV